jgi:acyl carrier protein|tara:strand:- start:52 stop:288 length:237 start_codon:yes stop_codon:yes gene_type:complete
MSKTTDTLIEVVRDAMDITITEDQLSDGTKFKDLNIDSLDVIEMLIQVEDRLNIELDDQRLEEVECIRDLVAYLREFE